MNSEQENLIATEGQVLNNIDTVNLTIEQQDLVSAPPVPLLSPPIQGPQNGLYEEKRSHDTTENTEVKGPDLSSNTQESGGKPLATIPQVTSPLMNGQNPGRNSSVYPRGQLHQQDLDSLQRQCNSVMSPSSDAKRAGLPQYHQSFSSIPQEVLQKNPSGSTLKNEPRQFKRRPSIIYEENASIAYEQKGAKEKSEEKVRYSGNYVIDKDKETMDTKDIQQENTKGHIAYDTIEKGSTDKQDAIKSNGENYDGKAGSEDGAKQQQDETDDLIKQNALMITGQNSKQNMFEIPSDQDDSKLVQQNIDQVDFNWIQGEVDQIQKQIQQEWKQTQQIQQNNDMITMNQVQYQEMEQIDQDSIKILPEEVFIYEKALQDLEIYDAVDKPAQRLTLLMGPKKPIDYDNLQNQSEPQRKSQLSNKNMNLKPIEKQRGSQLQSQREINDKPQSISPQNSAQVVFKHNQNHLQKSTSSNFTHSKGIDMFKSENVNFYDKPRMRKDSKLKMDSEGRPMNQKEMHNLNSDLNSFRSQENDSYIQHHTNGSADLTAQQQQLQNQLFESTVESVIHVDSAGKMQSTMSKQSIKNITRNRNYMNSDVGTTIIENENGEEQSQHNERNLSKQSDEKDITLMDNQQVKIKCDEMDAPAKGFDTYGSSEKLLLKSDSQTQIKNRVFSAGHTISQQNVQKFGVKNRMDSINNGGAASRDTFQSRTKLTNDRYQLNINNGQGTALDKRPITANPTANQYQQRRKMMQSQGFKLNSNSLHPLQYQLGLQPPEARNFTKLSSGYFQMNPNVDNTSSNFPDNESLRLMFNTESNPQNAIMTHSKTSKKRAANLTLFGKNPQIQRIKSSHISSRQGKRHNNNFMGGGPGYMNLGAEYNLIKTRSSINDQKSSQLNRTRDKTPKIESTTLSMRVPNKPKTTIQDNSVGRYNGESAFGVQKINDSAEIDMLNNNVTPIMNQTELIKNADSRPYADTVPVGYESNLENQISHQVGFISKVPQEKYRSMNLKPGGGKNHIALTSLEHPIIAKKRDLVKNFQRIKMQNRLIQDGTCVFKRSKSGNKYKPTQMPGSGAVSYTNYKLTTKSNPYLGSILPETQPVSESTSYKHMPISKARTMSHVKQGAALQNPGFIGGRRKRELNNVIRKAHEMETHQDVLYNKFQQEVEKVEQLLEESQTQQILNTPPNDEQVELNQMDAQ